MGNKGDIYIYLCILCIYIYVHIFACMVHKGNHPHSWPYDNSCVQVSEIDLIQPDIQIWVYLGSFPFAQCFFLRFVTSDGVQAVGLGGAGVEGVEAAY